MAAEQNRTSVQEHEDLSPIIKIDAAKVSGHLNDPVRKTVAETLNGMLDAEAQEMCQARRYERTDARKDCRAGFYQRKLQTQAGEVELNVPKLRYAKFETAIIERYRRRESSVEAAAEFYPEARAARHSISASPLHPAWESRDSQGRQGVKVRNAGVIRRTRSLPIGGADNSCPRRGSKCRESPKQRRWLAASFVRPSQTRPHRDPVRHRQMRPGNNNCWSRRVRSCVLPKRRAIRYRRQRPCQRHNNW